MERLKEQPISGVKSILNYAYNRLEELEDEMEIDPTEKDYYLKEIAYWQEVVQDCRQEIEIRIKQIFPI